MTNIYMTTMLNSSTVPGLVLSSIPTTGLPLGVDYIQLDNYFVYAYGSIKNPPAVHLQVTADFILAFPELLSDEMSENMSEVLIDKYLLDKYLAPFDIDSEGTQLTVSMISMTNSSLHSSRFQPRRPTTPNIQDDILTTYRSTPCHFPNNPAHTATLNPSRCHPELFHSLLVSQPFPGPWSTIDRYEQFPPLARETDFTQRPNNTYTPNYHIAHMTAPDVPATDMTITTIETPTALPFGFVKSEIALATFPTQAGQHLHTMIPSWHKHLLELL